MSGQIADGEFRDALARFATGVVVVATFTREGPAGLTVSAFTSVSLVPRLVLACIGRSSRSHAALVEAPRFGVSVLAEHQGWVAERCASRGDDRFATIALVDGIDVPWIAGAAVHLACTSYERRAAGDHTLLIGEVERVALHEQRPLLHFARTFGSFAPALRRDERDPARAHDDRSRP